MPNVHRTHHTRLDSLLVAPYDVETLFGIDGGPLKMALHFSPHGYSDGQMGPNWKSGPRVKILLWNCLMGRIKSQWVGKHYFGPFLLCPGTSSGRQGSRISFFLVAKWPLGENSTDAWKQPWSDKMTKKYPAWIYHNDIIHVCQLKSHYDLGPGIPQNVSSFTPQNSNFGSPGWVRDCAKGWKRSKTLLNTTFPGAN